MELGVIDNMGFDAYFLIVWDFVKLRQGQRHRGRPGPRLGGRLDRRPTASTSPTSTRCAYDLLFERFLNPERVSMPDIDIDFSVRGRERVMRYVTDKYGTESVAQIVTFGKMLPRAATRDAARVLGHDYGDGRPARQAHPRAGDGALAETSRSAWARSPSCAASTTPSPRRADHRHRKGLEGIVRNAAIHAAAVVIADRPLTDIVPLQLMEDRGAGRRRRARLPDRHAVLDEADRGDQPAQDGLPRPAQPRRDRGLRWRSSSESTGRAAGHGAPAARRP